MTNIKLSENPMQGTEAVEIHDGMQVAFEKKYFFTHIIQAEGSVLKKLFKDFEMVIEGTTSDGVFIRFQARKQEANNDEQ